MRKIISFRTRSDDIKYKVLQWSSAFDRVCFLDSNGFSSSQKYSEFECKVAVDVIEEIIPESNCLNSLSKFIDEKNDLLFGYFSYDLKNEIENLSSGNVDGINFPLLHFFQPRYLIDIEKNKIHFSFLPEITDENEIENIFKEIESCSLIENYYPADIKIKSRFDKEEYLDVVEKIRDKIKYGDIYEMNFCQEFYDDNAEIIPENIFIKLNKHSPAPFSCFYKHGQKYLISSSPERFLKKTGNKLISQPIKGTIPRGKNEGEDNYLKNKLQNDPKERAENVMIVDLVRNDLSMIAKKNSVSVEELFGIYSFSHVHQMISTVTCELKEDIDPADIIRSTFPMGSMTGAPKIRAMQLIEEYEKTGRGLFSGAAGYFTPDGNFDFNVVIRSIQYNAARKYLSFITGSAITIDSVPEKEFEECLLKAKAMKEILAGNKTNDQRVQEIHKR